MQANHAGDCPLGRGAQTRNLLLFAACTGLQYLAAPVGYVGVTQASLCDKLGASATVANLPATMYFAGTAVPLVIAWFVPYVAYLKRTLIVCYAANAAALAGVAAVLYGPLPDEIKIASVIGQAAVAGMTMAAAIMFLWEVVGRGVSAARRGPALALAFGVGPLLAALSSFGSQLVLAGKFAGFTIPAFDLFGLSMPAVHVPDLVVSSQEFPGNFAALYALAAPVIALAALLAFFFIVPLPEREAVREPFVQGVFGGIWNYLNDRVLFTALVVTFLVYAGNAIPSNLNLYTKEVAGELPAQYAGLQNTLRFACKAVAGLLLGWLLTRTSPRAGLLATAAIGVAAVLWPLAVTGPWYHAAFVIFGAGELVGVYAPNYILSASRKQDMRRNLAIVTLLMAPGAVFGLLFGAIADVGKRWGAGVGFQLSFAVCAAFILAGIVLAVLRLPSRPATEVGSAHDVGDR